jgi:hypothetical protein
LPYDKKRGYVEGWHESPPDQDRYPLGYRAYHFANWLLDARDEKTSDWIFTRPYDWKDKIKPGWKADFRKADLRDAREAALLFFKREVVRVASVVPKDDSQVEIELVADEDPPGQFPMTVVCEQLANGRWRQARDSPTR